MKTKHTLGICGMLCALLMLPILSIGQLSVSTTYTAVTCNGFNTGMAKATASNGTTPYTYSWSGGAGTNSTATGLSAGTYTITVTDFSSASASASATITQPPALTTSASQISIPCYGTSNGNASASPSGGTTPYTYSWSNGSTSNPTGTTFSAGTYTVTVQDNCGASATASVTIRQYGAITATAFAGTPISCNGDSNGQAKVSVVGGASPYTYSWSQGGGSTYIASGLFAGTYSVTVTSNNGCSSTAAATLTQPAILFDSLANIGYPMCTGSAGSATIGVRGGTSPYIYNWSPNVSTTASASGLSLRAYAVQVKDVRGCFHNLTFSMTQPPTLRDSIVKSAIVNVDCNGGSTGSAKVGVKYGATPYTYSWSPTGGTKATATGLSAGTYTVTVNDGGCTVTASVNITQPATLSPMALVGNEITCNGGSNGKAKVSVSGGSPPYTYSWGPVAGSTYLVTGLSAGTYTVTVTGKCGASATSSVAITQPGPIRDSVASITYPRCSGETASAIIGVEGGMSPYRYIWSPNVSTTDSASGLLPRGYVVQVKDVNGCFNYVDFTILQSPTLRDSIVKSSTVNITCNGASTGSAKVGVKYGSTPYTYSWSPAGGSNNTATGLSAGTYTVTVSDGLCTVTASVNLTQPNALSVTADVISGGGCGESRSKGSASATPSGGTLPYTYSWSPAGGNDSIATGLSVGNYTVTVHDACGALVIDSANIQPLTVETSAKAISCNGDTNGQAKLSVSGGRAPYTYSWSPVSSSTYIAAGLLTGTYTATVTDHNGCNSTATATITQPAVLTDSVASISYPLCLDGTGSAVIGVTGGTSPYKYRWSPGVSTNNSAAGLSVRGYVVQVKDARGCFHNLNFSITQPPTLRDSIVRSATVNTCNGIGNGSATVGAKYGTGPYTYSWSNGAGNVATATGLSAGTYTVMVSDGSCSVTASVNITQPGILSPTASVGYSISCNGGSNGKARVSVSGGSSPYMYSWSPVASSTYVASGLSAGTYTVTVTDNCGTSATSSTTITQPAVLFDSVASSTSPPCSGGTGSATIGVRGGTSPYMYTWSPDVSSTDSAGGLTTRSYRVQVKDDKGCWNDLTIDVTCSQPVTVTYKAESADACCPVSENINLYPNPNTGQFTLSGLQAGMLIEMFDYTGKKISSVESTAQTMQLNISQANGVYLMRILDKDGNLVSEKKVMKTQ